MLQVVLQSPNATQESIYKSLDTKTNKLLSAHSLNKASMSKGKGAYEPPVTRSSPRIRGKEDMMFEHAPTRSSPRAKRKEIVIYEPICTRSSPKVKGKGIIISKPICARPSSRAKGKGTVISEPICTRSSPKGPHLLVAMIGLILRTVIGMILLMKMLLLKVNMVLVIVVKSLE